MLDQNNMYEDMNQIQHDEYSSEDTKTTDSVNNDQDMKNPSESQPPVKPLNDLGNAERFVGQNGKSVRYCPELNCWFVYTDGRWIQDTGKLMYQMAKDTIKSIREEAKRDDLSVEEKKNIIAHADKSSSKGRINAMLDLAKWEDDINVTINQLDYDPWLLNCPNGTLNLKTKEFQSHNPSFEN